MCQSRLSPAQPREHLGCARNGLRRDAVEPGFKGGYGLAGLRLQSRHEFDPGFAAVDGSFPRHALDRRSSRIPEPLAASRPFSCEQLANLCPDLLQFRTLYLSRCVKNDRVLDREKTIGADETLLGQTTALKVGVN